MNAFDFHAHFCFALWDGATQAQAVEFLSGASSKPPVRAEALADWQGDDWARLSILAQAVATPYKDAARTGSQRGKDGGYRHWLQNAAADFINRQRQLMGSLGLIPSLDSLSSLPAGSWCMQFTFTLRKPWISRDDDLFYILDNPVRKDKVFKVPVMAASSWKGLLRWTLMHTRLALKKDELNPSDFAQERLRQTLLFGDEQGEEPGQVRGFAEYVDSLKLEARGEYECLLRRRFGVNDDDPLPRHSGRLSFYPTFFDGIDVEVINPHSRETRAGTLPIYLECVPAGATGAFSLLYVPFDLIVQPEAAIRQQAAEDLRIMAEGLQALFLTYGFSAKRTSGFGVAEENLKHGRLTMNAPDPSPAPSQPAPVASTQPLPKYLEAPGKLKPEYLNPDGTFRERSQAELNAMTKSQQQEYEKAKKWWEREGKALAESPPAEPEASSPAPESDSRLERDFSSFDELKRKADEVANTFGAGEAR